MGTCKRRPRITGRRARNGRARFIDLIEEYSALHAVDPNLIMAVVQVESGEIPTPCLLKDGWFNAADAGDSGWFGG